MRDNNSNFLNLKKSITRAGQSSFAIGVINVIMGVLFDVFSYTTGELDVTSLLIAIPLEIIVSMVYISLGSKLKKDELNNINKTYRRVNGLIIYTFILIALNLLLGSFVGLLVIFLLIDLFKARKELRNFRECMN